MFLHSLSKETRSGWKPATLNALSQTLNLPRNEKDPSLSLKSYPPSSTNSDFPKPGKFTMYSMLLFSPLIEKMRSMAGTSLRHHRNLSKEKKNTKSKRSYVTAELRSSRFFLIRWKGYSAEEDSWVPERNLKHAKTTLASYKKLHPTVFSR
jgi:hypothetical protein